MFSHKISGLVRRAATGRGRIALAATALTLALVPAGVAQAEYWYTESGARIVCGDYVSKHYADTFVSDLRVSVRPQGRRSADSRYKYHNWVCFWKDTSDGTSGAVKLTGSNSRGGYYGKVLLGGRTR